MKYQFKVAISAPLVLEAVNEEDADIHIGAMVDHLLDGCPLEKEYPDVEYDEPLFENGLASSSPTVTFKLMLDEADTRMWAAYKDEDVVEAAREKMEIVLREMVKGSPLDGLMWTFSAELHEDQPDMDRFLPDNDWSTFAVMEPGAFLHVQCAEKRYGEEAIALAEEMLERHSFDRIIASERLSAKFPKDDDGNLLDLSFVPGATFASDFRNAFPERISDTCDLCHGYLYDEPKAEEEEVAE